MPASCLPVPSLLQSTIVMPATVAGHMAVGFDLLLKALAVLVMPRFSAGKDEVDKWEFVDLT